MLPTTRWSRELLRGQENGKMSVGRESEIRPLEVLVDSDRAERGVVETHRVMEISGKHEIDRDEPVAFKLVIEQTQVLLVTKFKEKMVQVDLHVLRRRAKDSVASVESVMHFESLQDEMVQGKT